MTQTWRYWITYEGTVDADGPDEAKEFAVEKIMAGFTDYVSVTVKQEDDE